MTDRDVQKQGENLLRVIARRAIDYARAGNKGGLIRLRYLARGIADLLPFSRKLRLPHHDDGAASEDGGTGMPRPKRH